ncbi:MAG: protein sorting system archaetidylserine decarboxylase [Halobacteriaceae archaeon]
MDFAPGAWKYALPPLAVAVPALAVSPAASLALLALSGFVWWFFRDPERTPPEQGVLCPADGRVSVVREEGDRLRVGVFMNVTDVHVVRAPVGAAVGEVTHSPGAHRPAFTKDSDRNERVTVDLGDHELTLIAGAFARRIRPYVAPGDLVARGERVGHIAFGSRVDVRFPPGVSRDDLRVSRGESVRAGETVLAPTPQDTCGDAP